MRSLRPQTRGRPLDLADPVPAPPEIDVGAELRRARETRGISLVEAADATRISEQYLRAIEDGAPPDRFPGAAYARFFLRDYARYLGVDDDPVVAAFDARVPRQDPELSTLAPIDEPARWPGRLLVAVSLLGIAVVVIARVAAGGGSDQPPIVAPRTPTPAVTSSGIAPTPARQERPTAVRGIVARLTVRAPCWVRATADEEVILSETLQPGRSATVRADRSLDLVLGNAGGVRLVVNGDRVATGASGDVVQLSFVWRDGRVRTS